MFSKLVTQYNMCNSFPSGKNIIESYTRAGLLDWSVTADIDNRGHRSSPIME